MAGWSRADAINAVYGSRVTGGGQNMVPLSSAQCGVAESSRLAIERLGLRYEGLLANPSQITSGKLEKYIIHSIISLSSVIFYAHFLTNLLIEGMNTSRCGPFYCQGLRSFLANLPGRRLTCCLSCSPLRVADPALVPCPDPPHEPVGPFLIFIVDRFHSVPAPAYFYSKCYFSSLQ
ncbi:unnamed protein product [Protopolystoma xenopodis]|uniref:Uncharacterized protein n=1 Tax=Protopolystoma xenopodis TaxID=117903 RepID=A0A448WK30_9PLAT|nr:unnamed protein product [Protopolystoma xenopodis]